MSEKRFELELGRRPSVKGLSKEELSDIVERNELTDDVQGRALARLWFYSHYDTGPHPVKGEREGPREAFRRVRNGVTRALFKAEVVGGAMPRFSYDAATGERVPFTESFAGR